MRLYELTDQYRVLQGLMDDPECDAARVAAALEALTGELADKVDSLAGLVRHFEHMASAADAEHLRLLARRDAYQRRAESLRAAIQQRLEEACIEHPLHTPRFTVGLRKCPPSVRVLVEGEVPEEFIRIVPERREVNKVAVLEFFRRGGEIPPGVDIVTDRKTLSIR